MIPVDDRSHALLAILVGSHGADAICAALHPDVVLRRGDGSEIIGRVAVMAMFQQSNNGVRYRMVDAHNGVLGVAMSVPGMPGELRFSLRGEVIEGVLITIEVRVGDESS